MKKRFLQLGALIMLLVLTACSNEMTETSNILKKMPANVDVVAVGNFKTIIESAGGTVDESTFTLPSYITSMLSGAEKEQFEEIKGLMQNSGVSINACAVAGNIEDYRPIVIFELNDSEKFKAAIVNVGFGEKNEEDGVTYYAKKVNESAYNSDFADYDYIAIKESYAYYINAVRQNHAFNPMGAIKRLIEDAAKMPFADTEFCDYIVSGNVGGVAFKIPTKLQQELRNAGMPSNIIDIYKGVICLRGNLSADEVKIDLKFFEEDGKTKDLSEFSKFMDMNAKISSKVLSYMSKEVVLVYAASIKGVDWDSYMEMVANNANMSRSDRTMMNLVKSYLEQLDGTVAFGVGLKNGMQSIMNIQRQQDILVELPVTMVCETKPGKAVSILNDIKVLLESKQVEFVDKSNGLSLSVPNENGTVFIEAEDDVLILSNRVINEDNDNLTVNNIDFADYIVAAGLYLDKNNPLMTDFQIDNDVLVSATYDAKAVESTMTLKVEGDNSTGVLEKVFSTIIEVANR